ncbi:MAG: patatin family protein [Clostridia bacterium]|nr:patatin family protein [Clostridia bacterium]
MKTGLVLEGGAMRGMFTAGVLDVFMENGITFPGVIGVSAGAVFGCNLKSNQPGRVIRYNTTYSRDPRYVSLRSLITTGDLYGEQFCYHELPDKLDPFDYETFANAPMEFYVVATDVTTGKPVYHLCGTNGKKELQWLRASASMPVVSRVVEVDGHSLLDGGVADSVPLQYFETLGYKRNVVVLTQPAEYRKKKSRLAPLMKLALRKYPRLAEVMARRHEEYNKTIEYIRSREETGAVLVIRPEESLGISRTERDPDKLRAVYALGRKAAEAKLEEVRAFLQKE